MLLGHANSYVDIRDPDNWTALWHAVHQGDEDLVQLLLDSGSDIHGSDMEDVTPLYLSIGQANVSMVQTLLRYSRRDRSTPTPGANPRINNEPPPLCLATSQGSEDIVRLLLESHRGRFARPGPVGIHGLARSRQARTLGSSQAASGRAEHRHQREGQK
jgi:hypothetical protein